MQKFFGVLLIIVGFIFVPFGIGFIMMLYGARLLNK